MHIGIDLDNTVLDATTAHLNLYNQVSGRSLTPADVTEFYMYRLYGWNKTERDDIYHRYGSDIHWNSAPLPLAAEAIRKLYGQQHRISFITARPALFQDITVKWLEHHHMPYHHIAFVENKLQTCIDDQVDVLIDDGPHYATQFALAGRPVILYEQPYNLSIDHPGVLRAANWDDVSQHIDRLALSSNQNRLL